MSSWARLLPLGAALLLAAAAPAPPPVPQAEQEAQLAKDAPAVKPLDAKPGAYGLGVPATDAEIAGWAIGVRPDGKGLPPGSGTVDHGADVFSQQCAPCHGTFGEGVDRYPKLAEGSALTGEQPVKTLGNYWPYATTVWDYINRAMPFPAPHSLSADDVYAITAYLLNLNNIVPDNFVADQNSLPKVKMPNRDGFILLDPRPDTKATRCMSNCATEVQVSSTAEGKDLTPRTSGPLDTMQGQ